MALNSQVLMFLIILAREVSRKVRSPLLFHLLFNRLLEILSSFNDNRGECMFACFLHSMYDGDLNLKIQRNWLTILFSRFCV